MNEFQRENSEPCELGLTPELLSGWYDQAHSTSEAESLRAHIRTCAACQRHLAAYAAIDSAVRRFEPPAALVAFAEAPLRTTISQASGLRARDLFNNHNHAHLRDRDDLDEMDEVQDRQATDAPLPARITNRRQRQVNRHARLVSLGAMAAVLLVVLGAVALFRYPSLFGGEPRVVFHGFRYPLNANSSDIATMDPARVQDHSSAMPVSMVFPGLLTLDNSGNPVPWAAESMPVYDTAAHTYTFKIRAGLQWSDGTPIDAHTFAYSLNRSLSPCVKSPVASYLYAINDAQAFATEICAADGRTVKGAIPSLIGDSLCVPDNQTLVIYLSQNAPYFLDALTYPVAFAQPEQLIDRYGQTAWTSHLTDHGGFGGNLYKLQTWDHEGDLVLLRNAAFWGAAPELREVDFRVYRSMHDEYTDYLNGLLDVGFAPPDQYNAAKQRSDFHAQPAGLAIRYYQPNWAKAPFDNSDARQAFALALNKYLLANTVWQDAVVATNHIVPQGMYGYNPNLVGPDGTVNLTGNMTMARQLMQKYVNEACGGKVSACAPMTLVDSDDPAIIAYDEEAVHMWQQAFPGYPIRMQFMDSNSLLRQIDSSNVPQIYGMTKTLDYADPQNVLSLQFAPNSTLNVGSVDIPVVSILVGQADQNLDPTTRASQYNQAEQLLVAYGGWIPLSQQKLDYNLPDYVQGLQLTPFGTLTLATWQQLDLTAH